MHFQLPIMQVIFSLPHHMLLSVHHVRDMRWLSPSSLSTCCSRPSYGAAPGGPLCSWKESLISVILEQLWGFRHSLWRPSIGFSPPSTRYRAVLGGQTHPTPPDDRLFTRLTGFQGIGSVFNGATLAVTTPAARPYYPRYPVLSSSGRSNTPSDARR